MPKTPESSSGESDPDDEIIHDKALNEYINENDDEEEYTAGDKAIDDAMAIIEDFNNRKPEAAKRASSSLEKCRTKSNCLKKFKHKKIR